MHTALQVKEGEILSISTIEAVIRSAIARPVGLTLPVSRIGKRELGYIQPIAVTGDITKVVVKKESIGFAIEKDSELTSFVTTSQEATDAFMLWLNKANASALRGQDYGVSPGNIATFQRSA